MVKKWMNIWMGEMWTGEASSVNITHHVRRLLFLSLSLSRKRWVTAHSISPWLLKY